MSAAIQLAHDTTGAMIERVVIQGDLSKLSPADRAGYYGEVCKSLGLNPLTRPFEYITLNGKLVLYARRDCTDQLRNIHGVTVTIVSRERLEEVYVVTARAILPSGRSDESIGAVPIQNLKGESLANALMKAETKAKRRVTLSICGLAMLDEAELDGIQDPKRAPSVAEIMAEDEPVVASTDSPFDRLRERLDTLEELVAKCRTYEEALTIRAELGSRAKQSQLLRDLQEASGKGQGPRTITGAEHKQLSAAWGRADRQLSKKENDLAPSVEASFIDPEPEERQPGED